MKTKLNIALLAIKESTANELKQIDIKVSNDEIVIISLLGNNGVMLHTDLVIIPMGLNLGHYVNYNEETKNCELHIF